MSSAALICSPISCNTPISTLRNGAGRAQMLSEFTSSGGARRGGLAALGKHCTLTTPHRPVSGYANTVRIAQEDVVAFSQRFYVANNAIVVMVGALPEERMLRSSSAISGIANATTGIDALPQPA
jgi:hypothetical protein